ncbi:MAG: acetyl-CoA carboxylase biotin carboxyl carrier protein subunit [Candidatus Rokuibacteriota bacterium]|nr:MAG: acetyl-CoA carboxylase biotin carboxyl carrier protein subunit [Candidatus Rokubacteria bacterium]
MRFEAELGGSAIPVEVSGTDGRYLVTVGDDVPEEVDARQAAEGIWSLLIGGASYVVEVSERDGVSVVGVDGERYHIRVEEETRYTIRTRGGKAATGGQVLKAPMPGKVVHIHAQVGQSVKVGDTLIVLEAMKMENEFRAAVAGRVTDVRVQVGQAVNPGDTLVVIE